MKRQHHFWPGGLVLGLLWSLGCGGTTSLVSQPASEPPTLQGDLGQWTSARMVLEDEDLELAFYHDDAWIYLALTTSAPMLQTQIITRGLTVWFDPAGGKEKVAGIRFPLGLQEMREENQRAAEGRPQRGNGNTGARSAGASPQRGLNPQRLQRLLDTRMTELEILIPNTEPQRFPIADAGSIQVKAHALPGILLYELKIPRASTETWPIDLAQASFGLGLETPRLNRPSQFGTSGATTRGGRAGGRGSAGAGGGRGGGRGATARSNTRLGTTNRLNVWATVTLGGQ